MKMFIYVCSMKAEELRIGNSVLYDGREVKFNLADLLEANQGSGIMSLVEPIPLNDFRFKRLGFDFFSEELGAKVFSISVPGSVSQILVSDKGHLTLKSENTFWYMRSYKCPEYVHELQNLFFALTGHELNFK